MRPSAFRWIEWNENHATSHGCTIREIERVVFNNNARRVGREKWQSVGRGVGGRMVEVVFLLDPDGTTAFILHAMPLTTRRRRGKR